MLVQSAQINTIYWHLPIFKYFCQVKPSLKSQESIGRFKRTGKIKITLLIYWFIINNQFSAIAFGVTKKSGLRVISGASYTKLWLVGRHFWRWLGLAGTCPAGLCPGSNLFKMNKWHAGTLRPATYDSKTWLFCDSKSNSTELVTRVCSLFDVGMQCSLC